MSLVSWAGTRSGRRPARGRRGLGPDDGRLVGLPMKNSVRQSPQVRIQPDSGAVMIEEMAMFIIQNP